MAFIFPQWFSMLYVQFLTLLETLDLTFVLGRDAFRPVQSRLTRAATSRQRLLSRNALTEDHSEAFPRAHPLAPISSERSTICDRLVVVALHSRCKRAETNEPWLLKHAKFRSVSSHVLLRISTSLPSQLLPLSSSFLFAVYISQKDFAHAIAAFEPPSFAGFGLLLCECLCV